MSIAGDVIRDYRTQKKWSQTDLAGRCENVDVSLISRFENGKTETPSREAMMQILAALELHPLKFYEECRKRELSDQKAGGPVFRIGWGHCIWGAPLVIPAYESLTQKNALEGISLTSYGVYDEHGALSPYVYDTPTDDGNSIKRGPSFAQCFEVRQSTMSLNAETWRDRELKTFTADDVQTLYRNGMLDGMVVPNRMARAFVENHPDLMRCASIMFTGEACTFLVLWKEKIDETIEEDAEVSQKYSPFRRFLGRREDLQLTVFFARGTIAEVQLEDHMKDLVTAVQKKNPTARVQPREVDLGNWNRGASSFIHQFREEFEARGVACFLGWEPHITWAIQEIRGYFGSETDRSSENAQLAYAHDTDPSIHYYEVELRELLAHLDPQFKSSSQHPIQFDMVISQAAFAEEGEALSLRIENLNRFFASLSNAAGRITRAQNAYNRNVQYIASYLDMPPDRCLEALRKLSFSLWYHPEWVEFSRRLVQEGTDK